MYASWDDTTGLAATKKKKREEEKTQLHGCPCDSVKAEVHPGESDHLLWFSPVLCRWYLTRNKEKDRRKERPSYSCIFYLFVSSLVEEELTFLALAAVSKQKAAMWWVWLAADGGEISGRAVRWMPSWPACDVQFVARALGRKALKILLAVTQREMWCSSKKALHQIPFCSLSLLFTATRTGCTLL